jgi:xanthine dehydrogenase YagR molybdenum-binding subunit
LIYPARAKELCDYEVVSNLPPGKPFRGPSGPVTAWALEQAVDEAAARLGEDPIALRCRWDPDPLRQRLYAWALGLDLWRARPATGSQSGRYRRGVGVAAANWIYFFQTDCQVKVGIKDGCLYVSTAAQDPGTGIRSVLAQAVAGVFNIEPAAVQVRIGDTSLARGPSSSASRTTATLLPTALVAAARLREKLMKSAGIEQTNGVVAWKEVLASAPDTEAVADRPGDDRSASNAAPPLDGTGLLGLLNVWVFRLWMKLGIGLPPESRRGAWPLRSSRATNATAG